MTRAAACSPAVLALVALALGPAPARATSPQPDTRRDVPAAATVRADEQAILHVLRRFTYGPRPGDVDRVRAMGLGVWLERQLAPDSLADDAVDVALRELPTPRLSIADLLRQFPRPEPGLRAKVQTGEMSRRELLERYPPDRRPARITGDLQAAKAVRAAMSERQLQEVMVDFWFNHFNVSAAKGDGRWYVTAYERDVIRPHALGRFADLLRATARHPAMLYYLDNWLSVRDGFVVPFGPAAGRRAGLNENYARELMELHTLGVDGGYTQQDVREVARAFTGWSINRQGGAAFVFRPRVHDDGGKVVLGRRFLSGGGREDGEQVLTTLARHPATARLVATKLARRFVSDDPPPALVERVAATYTRTDGDIRAMLRALVGSPEFLAEEARAAKIKRPFEFVISAVRALGATVDARGGAALAQAAARIGESVYECEPPSGYADRAEPWVNPGALLARMNFGLALAHGRLPGVHVDVDRLVAGPDRRRPEQVLDTLLAAVIGSAVGAQTRSVLTAQLGDPEITRLSPDDRGPASTDVAKLLALVIGAPEFQRR